MPDMSTRPTELHIMGQCFKVAYHLDPDQPIIYGGQEEMKVGEQAMGYTNSVMQEITVRGVPAAGFHAERDTMLHESLHAIFALTGLDNCADEVAEDIILRLTPALFTLIRDNPAAMQYLQEEEPA